MNEYSYQQGHPPHKHRNYPDAPPTYEGNTYHYSAVETNAGLAQSSYDFNKGVIPGLAFGFSGGNQISQSQGSLLNQHGSDSLAIPAATAQHEALSEGELEDDDIYEPVADENAGPSKDKQHADTEQDRAGSYSPAFSAGEVNESLDSLRPSSRSTASNIRPTPNVVDSRQARGEMSAADQVRKVREDACAAISNLRLFDLPQQTYQDYNIDKSVLQSLFRELGLDLPSQVTNRTSGPVAPAATDQLPSKPKPTVQAKPASALGTDPVASSGMSPPKDGSESRKDRIARLLAAKSSRQASVPQSAKPAAPNDRVGKEADANISNAPSDPVSTETSAPLPNKPGAKSLEKSKLLQQKMEALRRLREAKALSSSAPPDVAQQPPQKPAADAAIAPANNTSVQSEFASTADLSSSQFPAAPRNQGMKRPVASDFDTPSFAPSKRQYGQPQEARQFLIHVSDDEDESDNDTEMDIETPEEGSQLLATAAGESSLLRNHPPLSASPYRGQQSPANTPGRPKSIIGSENLSKMYRNIEEMKRRIKEAEASKQAKTSRSATPLETSAKSTYEQESSSSAAVPEALSRVSPTSSAAESPLTEAPVPTKTNGAIAQARPGPRRSLSRTAQERLTSIESERKNKELKMRIMRAKIAQMEREMAASLQEEEALYDQGDDEDLDDLLAESAAMGDGAQSVQTPAQPTESETASPAREVYAPQSHPSPSVRPAPSVEAEVISNETPQDLPTTTEAENALDIVSRQPTEEVNETSEDDDAEMKDLTEAETNDSDSDDDHTNETAEPSNDAETADPVVANAESDVAKNDQENEGSTCESESAADETDSDQEESDGEISDEEPDRAHSEAADEREEPAQQGEPTAQSEAEAEAKASSPVEQTSDIDELMGVKQPTNPSPPSDTTTTAEATAGFRPYESPLSYFHAYRFHPEFQKAVKGGLRSLTYSNKIDVQKPMCPDELAGGECPRGPRCNFQHLGKISTPDDQILMQLGSYGAREGDEQERFNNGLRALLQELKGKESQDFAAISQAIIDYRAQFHGDKSKILPLGNVPI